MKLKQKLGFLDTIFFYLNKKAVQLFLACIVIVFTSLLYFRYSSSFAFVDEFNNFLVRYFMDRGRSLYTSIFFNHQFLPAYISYALQYITHTETLIRVVTIHRLFMIIFSAACALLLVARFGLPALGFIAVYESFKYYSFGFTFQAESMIVYVFVYIFALVWMSLKDKKYISRLDLLAAVVGSWFCVYMREPYIPLTLFLFGSLIWIHRKNKIAIFSVILFMIGAVIPLLFLPLKEYIHQVFVLNSQGVAADELGKESSLFVSLLYRIFYPALTFVGWKYTYYRYLLMSMSGIVISMSVWYVWKLKRYGVVIFIWTALFFATPRFIPPGTELYAGYRMVPWFGLFTMITFLLFSDKPFMSFAFRTRTLILSIFSLTVLFILFSPWSFVWRKIDRTTEFHINYSPYFLKGEVVRQLASPGDTFYIDGYDSLMYWQSGLDSPYRYAFFYPVMLSDSHFVAERNQMLETKKPTFFFKECVGNYPNWNTIKKEYVPLKLNTKNSCFYIHRSKVETLDPVKLEGIKKYGFTL